MWKKYSAQNEDSLSSFSSESEEDRNAFILKAKMFLDNTLNSPDLNKEEITEAQEHEAPLEKLENLDQADLYYNNTEIKEIPSYL